MTNITQIPRCFIDLRKKVSICIGLGLSVMLLLGAGCREKERLDSNLQNLGRATGPIENVQAPVSPVAPGKVHSGSIVETMDVPNYTYIRFKSAGGQTLWAAVPKDKVHVGEEVEVVESLVMKDFNSPTLSRTFPSIIFGILKPRGTSDGGPSKKASTPLPPGHPPIERPVDQNK
ncbi:MAG: hypothetical protein GY854_27000 [Deltaproteobacteria bacterium]|nr:hypothetical protein [Deltaproteobacteria bacterium]